MTNPGGFPWRNLAFIPLDPLMVYSFSSKDGDLEMFFFPSILVCWLGWSCASPFVCNHLGEYEWGITVLYRRHSFTVVFMVLWLLSSLCPQAHPLCLLALYVEVMLQMPHLGLSTSVSSLCFDQFWFSIIALKSFFDKECTCPWVWR